MSWQKRKQQAEERSKVADQMKTLAETADGRKFSDDEQKQFDDLEQRCQSLTASIEQYDRLLAAIGDATQNAPDQPEQRSGQPGREDVPPGSNSLGVPERDMRSYSLLKVIRSQVEHRSLDGIERELSDEISRQANKSPEGVYVPHSIIVERRDLTSATGSGAIGTTTAPTLIEMLRAKALVTRLGARIMGGLVGDFSIPKQTGGATSYWVTEGNAPTESDQTIGQVGLAPSTVGAFTDMSRKFVKQSSVDAEQFVRSDLATVIALAIDAAVLNGSGVGSEPTGILQDNNVSTVAIDTNGGAASHAKIVELETTVAAGNADFGGLHYVTSAAGRGALKTTPKVAEQATYLWSESNQLNGYPAHATNLIPTDLTKGTGEDLSAVIFGNWADVIVGMWGGLDILVDPYTGGNAGNVRVNALQDVDIALRHAESFAKIVDLVTS